MDRDRLLTKIENFKAATGMSDTAIGLQAVNDGKFVSELRTGRRCWPETAQRVVDFIDKHTKRAAA